MKLGRERWMGERRWNHRRRGRAAWRSEDRSGLPNLPSVLDAIGETPPVELPRLAHGLDGRILAKLDDLNPGPSKEDRIAKQTIQDAEADGRLRPGQTVIEPTSGKTGTGLAIVCAVKSFDVQGTPLVARAVPRVGCRSRDPDGTKEGACASCLT